MAENETISTQRNHLEKKFEESDSRAKARFDEIMAKLEVMHAEILKAILGRPGVVESSETKKHYIQ